MRIFSQTKVQAAAAVAAVAECSTWAAVAVVAVVAVVAAAGAEYFGNISGIPFVPSFGFFALWISKL